MIWVRLGSNLETGKLSWLKIVKSVISTKTVHWARPCVFPLPIFHFCVFWGCMVVPIGSTAVHLFLFLGKPSFFITFCSKLSLRVFIKVVDMEFSFHLPFVWLHLNIYNLRYNQSTTHAHVAFSWNFSKIPSMDSKNHWNNNEFLRWGLGSISMYLSEGSVFRYLRNDPLQQWWV